MTAETTDEAVADRVLVWNDDITSTKAILQDWQWQVSDNKSAKNHNGNTDHDDDDNDSDRKHHSNHSNHTMLRINDDYKQVQPPPQRNNKALYFSGDYDPKKYNYSYSEWKQSRNYTTEQRLKFTDFITSLLPHKTMSNKTKNQKENKKVQNHPNEECNALIYTEINICLDTLHIPAIDLIIALLYSSYHLTSPYIIPALKYILLHFRDNICYGLECQSQYNHNRNHNGNGNGAGAGMNLSLITSISNPRYTIAHIAAMYDDSELLHMLFEFDVNSVASSNSNARHPSSNFSPIHIAIGKTNFNAILTLLSMNVQLNVISLLYRISFMNMQRLLNIVSCLTYFMTEMVERQRSMIMDALKTVALNLDANGGVHSADNVGNANVDANANVNVVNSINSDVCQCIIEYVLPINTYAQIKCILGIIQHESIASNVIQKYQSIHCRTKKYRSMVDAQSLSANDVQSNRKKLERIQKWPFKWIEIMEYARKSIIEINSFCRHANHVHVSDEMKSRVKGEMKYQLIAADTDSGINNAKHSPRATNSPLMVNNQLSSEILCCYWQLLSSKELCLQPIIQRYQQKPKKWRYFQQNGAANKGGAKTNNSLQTQLVSKCTGYMSAVSGMMSNLSKKFM